MDRPGKVANPRRGQLNREKEHLFPCPRSRLRIWSSETGSAVPSPRVSLLISTFGLNLVLTGFLASSAAVHLFILNLHTPSGQYRVYRMTQLRTDGFHCRESATTVPVNLEVIPSEGCLGMHIFFLFFFFNLTYSRWTSSLPSCLWSLRIFPSIPGSRLTIFYRDASSALLQIVNQWLDFLIHFPTLSVYER